MQQPLRGFLQSSSNPKASLTLIASSLSTPNGTDRVFFNGVQLPTDAAHPFPSSAPPSSRAWTNATFDVSSFLSGTDSGKGYGEEAAVKIDQARAQPYDALAYSAIVFSTTVQDVDGDGLPDRLEDVSGLKDADGKLLPDLHAMGASSSHKDFFAEIGF